MLNPSTGPGTAATRPRPGLLRGLLREQAGPIAAGTLLLALAGSTGLAQPIVAARVVEATSAGESITDALLWLVGLLLVGAVALAGGYLLVLRASEGVVFGARRTLVHHVLRLPLAAVRGLRPGDVLARVTSDTSVLRQIATQTIVQTFVGLLTLVGALIMMAVVDLVLLGVAALVVAGAAGLSLLVMPRIRGLALRSQEQVGLIGTRLDRSLGAFEVIKAYGAEDREAARVTAAAAAARDAGLRLARLSALLGTAAGLATQVAFLAVLVVGGMRVAGGAISVATLITFLLYVTYLAQPAMQLINAGTYLQMARASSTRLRELLEIEPEDLGHRRPPGDTPGPGTELALEHVGFSYPGTDRAVLREVSLRLAPTGLTALVGPSGAGKSTILALLQGFAEPGQGHITVGGVDQRELGLAAVRARIGYVDQACLTVDGSLRENLTMGAPHADEQTLLDAIAVARLEPLLRRLGGDLDAPIGYRGCAVSGGERQRIAIARALVRDAPVLLMDEATSQLDAENELALREVVAAVARRRCVLVVAHRLSTVRDADQIVVLDDGRVRGVGTHDQLLVTDPLYRRFVHTQALADPPAVDPDGIPEPAATAAPAGR